jgi:uncharacterized membrane protein
MQPGRASTVHVQLTASGDETLPEVRLALQLPEGWTATAVGATDFTSAPRGMATAATFEITPPGYAPNADAVIHATATMGGMLREAGVFVRVS